MIGQAEETRLRTEIDALRSEISQCHEQQQEMHAQLSHTHLTYEAQIDQLKLCVLCICIIYSFIRT
jgi:uncharacterized protein YlxW (UPF0749 family)